MVNERRLNIGCLKDSAYKNHKDKLLVCQTQLHKETLHNLRDY